MNKEEFHQLYKRKREENKCRKNPVFVSREQIEYDVEKFLSNGGKIEQVPITACADNINRTMLHMTSNEEIIKHRQRMATKHSRNAKRMSHPSG